MKFEISCYLRVVSERRERRAASTGADESSRGLCDTSNIARLEKVEIASGRKVRFELRRETSTISETDANFLGLQEEKMEQESWSAVARGESVVFGTGFRSRKSRNCSVETWPFRNVVNF